MRFVILTLATTNEKVLMRKDSIVFATSEFDPNNNNNKFTRVYFEKVQIPTEEPSCVDVKETVEEIYKKIK